MVPAPLISAMPQGFAVPAALTRWHPPPLPVVFAVLVPRWPTGSDRDFLVLDVDELDRADPLALLAHERAPCWMARAGTPAALCVAARYMETSTREERRRYADVLRRVFAPPCAGARAPPGARQALVRPSTPHPRPDAATQTRALP